MGVNVDILTWSAVVVTQGTELELVHWVVGDDGNSLIDPDHWCWMSAVPEFAGARPDRPVPSATIEIVDQRPVRDRLDASGPNNTNWRATWRNPGDADGHLPPAHVDGARTMNATKVATTSSPALPGASSLWCR